MTVFDEITQELKYQESRWGFEADDTLNEPNDWVAYISNHASRWFTGGFSPYSEATIEAFRRQMIKVASLAVAAVQSTDRQRATGGPFYKSA